ncbi:unnamed protein product [Amoebophrya sp. A120]|nr:unnamed protein product [Amoebophrya sp. A120]|eukprot:GSA120T00021860001.1
MPAAGAAYFPAAAAQRCSGIGTRGSFTASTILVPRFLMRAQLLFAAVSLFSGPDQSSNIFCATNALRIVSRNRNVESGNTSKSSQLLQSTARSIRKTGRNNASKRSGLRRLLKRGNSGTSDSVQKTITDGTTTKKTDRKVHYLFLVYNHINNAESWRRYFQPPSYGAQDTATAGATTATMLQQDQSAATSDASSSDWAAYVHCKDGYTCQMPPFPATLIEPVPSSYCTDLVSPMIALLRKALENSHSTEDQFVFQSDSTLPVKPKKFVHETLFLDPQLSAFCMFPVSAWARRPMPDPSAGYEVAAKHHQWVTLSHAAATKLVANYNINAITYQSLLSSFGLVGWVCLDEYYMWSALVNTLQNIPAAAFQQRTLLDKFNEKAVRENLLPASTVAPSGAGNGLLEVEETTTREQTTSTGAERLVDRCYTLACWNVPSNPVIPYVQQQLQNRGLIRYDSVTRPGTLTHFTTGALKELRKSSFLFLRKVPDSPKILDSCESFEQGVSRILFADLVEPGLENKETDDIAFLTTKYQDQYVGTWVDVAHSDTRITSKKSAAAALGLGESEKNRQIALQAKSVSKNEDIWQGYGVICGSHVSLQFHDQVLEGELSTSQTGASGGLEATIFWANGAQWKKELIPAGVAEQAASSDSAAGESSSDKDENSSNEMAPTLPETEREEEPQQGDDTKQKSSDERTSVAAPATAKNAKDSSTTSTTSSADEGSPAKSHVLSEVVQNKGATTTTPVQPSGAETWTRTTGNAAPAGGGHAAPTSGDPGPEASASVQQLPGALPMQVLFNTTVIADVDHGKNRSSGMMKTGKNAEKGQRIISRKVEDTSLSRVIVEKSRPARAPSTTPGVIPIATPVGGGTGGRTRNGATKIVTEQIQGQQRRGRTDNDNVGTSTSRSTSTTEASTASDKEVLSGNNYQEQHDHQDFFSYNLPATSPLAVKSPFFKIEASGTAELVTHHSEGGRRGGQSPAGTLVSTAGGFGLNAHDLK